MTADGADRRARAMAAGIVTGTLLLTMLCSVVRGAPRGSDADSGAAAFSRGYGAAAWVPPFVDVRRFGPISGSAEAGKQKSAVCAGCHGADGQALAPAFPSLAAQQAGYAYLQLESYKQGWRKSPVMEPQVAQLTDEDMRDLAVYYAALPAKPAALPPGATPGDVSRGAELYLNGDSQKGVPPCQGCHGKAGEGPPPSTDGARRNLSTYPALAGLSAVYLKAQLMAYAEGSRSTTTNAKVMAGPARALDDESMSAIAAYLERLPASAAR